MQPMVDLIRGFARVHGVFRFGQVCALCAAVACGRGNERSGQHQDAGVTQESATPPGCETALTASATPFFYDAVRCLFEGPDAVQRELRAETLSRERIAVLRGRVLDSAGAPLAGVRVTVSGNSDYGHTLTRQDGHYDLAVNGGGSITLRYERKNYLPVQRHQSTQWRTFSVYPDVVQLVQAKPLERIALGTMSGPQLVQNKLAADAGGQRQHAVLLTPGTQVAAQLPDGSRMPLTELSMRMTEYTVGERGPAAMPSDLPEQSGYTYAVDLSLAELDDMPGAQVVFDPPLVNYLENFLGFPAGTVVPSGYYDEHRDAWKAGENGVVIKLLAIEDGVARLDVDGDEQADDDATLKKLGIEPMELDVLGKKYSAGTSLWRVRLPHLSAWDFNWPFVLPADAISPSPEITGSEPEDCQSTSAGSIIGCQDQTLGEELVVVGTPYRLHYQSERMPGREDSRALEIELAGESVPASLKRIELEVDVLGVKTNQSFDAKPGMRQRFAWDGLDAYGRKWQGRQAARIRVGYVYDGAYDRANGFGQIGRGTPISGSRTRKELTAWANATAMVGGFDYTGLGLGGWSFDVQHVYDRSGRVLLMGDGSRRSVERMGNVIRTVAGTGVAGFSGDGGSADRAQLNQPHGLVIAPDGTVFIAEEGNNRIRKIAPDGVISTIAGNGTASSTGDGGPAMSATLNHPLGLALGADGTLYIAERDSGRVRAIDREGTIRTFAGGGKSTDDGKPAIESVLREPHGLTIAPDGALYIVDRVGNSVRRVGADGVMTLVAGTGAARSTGDGGPAVRAELNDPLGIDIDDNGNLYVTEYSAHRIRKVDMAGVISTIAGTGTAGFSGDGGPAIKAQLNDPHDVQVGPDGSVYFTDESNLRIRAVRPDGTIESVAGSGKASGADPTKIGDHGPPLTASIALPRVLFYHRDGSLWFADYRDMRIRQIQPPLPGFTLDESYVASSDGKSLYVFDIAGRHLRTLDARNGATQLQFDYDEAGRVLKLKDIDGLETTVERKPDGAATAIVGPYNARTTLETDKRGYLVRLANPAQEVTELTYTDGGLLTALAQGPDGPQRELHRFSYDDRGRLLRDESPSGLAQTLSREELTNGYATTLSRNGERPERHEVLRAENGARTYVFKDAAGVTTRSEKPTVAAATSESPRSKTSTITAGDPRFGMQAPYMADTTYAPGGNLQYRETVGRSVMLRDASDPRSVTQLVETRTVNGQTWKTEWNREGSSVTLTSPLGRRSQVVLDAKGRANSQQIGSLVPTQYRYDERGRLLALATGDRSFAYEYGDDGRVSATINGVGERTEFRYDLAGRRTKQRFSDGRELSWRYDGLGRILDLDVPGGKPHQFEYLPGNLLAKYVPPAALNAQPTSYAYDKFEALTRSEDGSGEGWAYEYDGAGRVSRARHGDASASYSYDPITAQLAKLAADEVEIAYGYTGSLLQQLSYSGAIAGTVSYAYDNDLRIVSERVGSDPINFAYDKDGLLTGAGGLTLTRDADQGLITGTSLGSSSDTLAYNTYGERSGYTAKQGSNELYASKLERDPLGRIVKRSESVLGEAHDWDYRYDARGRLREVLRDGNAWSNYVYDANGNRTAATTQAGAIAASYDDQDRLVNYGDTGYTYSPSGSLSRKQAGEGATEYKYNRAGALQQVKLPDGRAIDYVLDGLGRRVGKRVDGKLTAGFLYGRGLQPIAALDASGKVTARFVFAARGHVPSYLTKDGVSYRIVSDDVGSVRLVVKTSDGSVVQRIEYDEHGRLLSDSSPGFQPFGFAGGLYDPDTGLVRLGARDYDAVTGRWTAKDPIGFAGGDTNLYAYVNGDPINGIDPNGLIVETAWDIASIGLDLYSLKDSVECGSGWDVALDAGALALDIAAVALPFVPAVGAVLSKANKAQRYGEDAAALIDLAKEAKRGGVSPDDAKTLLKWAEEYKLSPAHDHIGTDHWVGGDHIRVGPVNHIPVR